MVDVDRLLEDATASAESDINSNVLDLVERWADISLLTHRTGSIAPEESDVLNALDEVECWTNLFLRSLARIRRLSVASLGREQELVLLVVVVMGTGTDFYKVVGLIGGI